jgi:hypothetical protein
MKNHETTLKNHGNQPKTMKNHETTLKNHGSDDFLLQTYRQTDTSPLYIYHHAFRTPTSTSLMAI